jgi:hypothetical protein
MTATPRPTAERVSSFLQWFESLQRLGLPQDVLSRMPPPDPAAISDVEVEWEEWKAPAS